jgi:hypothetical protein
MRFRFLRPAAELHPLFFSAIKHAEMIPVTSMIFQGSLPSRTDARPPVAAAYRRPLIYNRPMLRRICSLRTLHGLPLFFIGKRRCGTPHQKRCACNTYTKLCHAFPLPKIAKSLS